MIFRGLPTILSLAGKRARVVPFFTQALPAFIILTIS